MLTTIDELIDDTLLRSMAMDTNPINAPKFSIASILTNKQSVDKETITGVWGNHTVAIFKEIQKIGNLMSLPSLANAHKKRCSVNLGPFQASPGASVLVNLLLHFATLVKCFHYLFCFPRLFRVQRFQLQIKS